MDEKRVEKSYRNNVPVGKNIPLEWNVGGLDRKTGKWDRGNAVNIRWIAALGSNSYGNPVVASGKVFVGTNNGAGYLKRYPNLVDLGCLLCFDEKTGEILVIVAEPDEDLDTSEFVTDNEGLLLIPVSAVKSIGEVIIIDANKLAVRSKIRRLPRQTTARPRGTLEGGLKRKD